MSVKQLTVKEQAAIALQKAKVAQGAIEDDTDYGKSVVGGIRGKGISIQAEIALHRKALMHLINKYGAENDAELAEFLNYNNLVEEVKQEVKDKHDEYEEVAED